MVCIVVHRNAECGVLLVPLALILPVVRQAPTGWCFGCRLARQIVFDFDLPADAQRLSPEFDMDSLGFNKDEMEELLKESEYADIHPAEFKQVDEFLATEHKCPKCKYVWSGKPKSK
jgi:hypothetical protein